MQTTQIYSLVNNINKQTMGKNALTVVDTNSFIAMGQTILESTKLTEAFANTLVLRITRSIISFRRYQSPYRPIVFDDTRWGAIVQKIKVEMPEATEDESYELVEGQSIDMYKVHLPKFHQKFFVTRTPYKFYVTLQLWQLEEAFTSESAFNSLISAIYGEVQNKLELSFENLGRLAVNNFMANIIGTTQEVKLLTRYNNDTGKSLTPATAMFDADFLRYSIATMNLTSRALEMMSTLYNAEGFTRHTPKSFQKFSTIATYQERLATVVQYEAFNEQYLRTDSSMVLPYWQSPFDPFAFDVTDKEGTEVKGENVIAFIHDRDALGTYRKETRVLTTPINAAAQYTNTYWHERQMWFNDLSENAVVFTLS